MAEKYKQYSHREHILELPDTYIGSVETSDEPRWVFEESAGHMVHKSSIHYNPGLYKIFDEVIVNARDALVRSQTEKDKTPVKRIDVTVGLVDEVFTISVKNDGDGIPIEEHPKEKCYVPEMIFGRLLTSSNYDKTEEKIVGGKNGYGSKICNVFSTKFTVKIRDPKNQKHYDQTWRNNMSICEKPHIKKDTSPKGFVEVIFCPDLTRFKGVTKKGATNDIHDDMKAILQTRVIELAALAGKDVTVTWNGTTVKTDTFEKYVKLFLREGSEKSLAYERCGSRWEVAAILTTSLFSEDAGTPDDRHISFVNGIYTRKGGKHVETVQRHVLSDVCEAAQKKKKLDLKPAQIKDNITLFINATIVNPSFESQTKETLSTPASKFGSSPTFSGKLVDGLVKAGILEQAAEILEAKLAKDAKKTDGTKKRTIRGLPKLEDALWAGTSKSEVCTLILTEGDSAATSAIAGLKVVGREQWGVFPLRGKLLNVKDISKEKFNANEELTAIKKILGLEQGRKYKSVKDLRYGRVLIMSDQDVDGFHIRGLVMNLFHTEWPELMQIGFLCSLMTPLVKLTKGSETLCFYSDAELLKWQESVGDDTAAKYKSKYYKGLGTSTPAEAREWFENLQDIHYIWDEETNNSLELAFNKKRADDRKKWLSSYDPKRSIELGKERNVPFTKFVHDELIHFSNADNLRSLPHLMDGLKPSQRKILFGCFKRNLRSEIRVAQLAGYISEHAAYHHGEASLNQTITGMAQVFVAANTINLLAPVGQFGSRLMGGKDAASPRYIHTHLEAIIDNIFKKDDQPILNYLEDDGDKVEPDTYLPVVPLLAINGSVGIGTGFSTDIPPHNPKEIVECLKDRIEGKLGNLAGLTLNPWWIGFKGQVVKAADKQWITKGSYEFNDASESVKITDLPVGTWTKDYKIFLDAMAAAESAESKMASGKPILKSFDDLYNDVDVNFVLYLDSTYYKQAKKHPEDFEKKFKLTTSWKTSNMCCFDPHMNIKKYDTVGDILENFYEHRIAAYQNRKAYQIATLKDLIEELSAKYKFLQGIVKGTIQIINQADEVVLSSLQKHELPPRSDRENPNTLGAFEYLLRMRVDRIKKSSVEEAAKELEEAQRKLKELEGTPVSAIWLKELDEFLKAWEVKEHQMLAIMSASSEKKSAGAGGKKKLIKKIVKNKE